MVNKAYKLGDMLETSNGLMFVQCSLVFQGDWAGRVLHWLNNELGEDIMLWDHELDAILTKEFTDDHADLLLDEDDTGT